MEKKKTNIKFLIITVSLLVLGSIYGIYKYNHAQSHEETDDAQIEKNMTPIIPRVAMINITMLIKCGALIPITIKSSALKKLTKLLFIA